MLEPARNYPRVKHRVSPSSTLCKMHKAIMTALTECSIFRLVSRNPTMLEAARSSRRANHPVSLSNSIPVFHKTVKTPDHNPLSPSLNNITQRGWRHWQPHCSTCQSASQRPTPSTSSSWRRGWRPHSRSRWSPTGGGSPSNWRTSPLGAEGSPPRMRTAHRFAGRRHRWRDWRRSCDSTRSRRRGRRRTGAPCQTRTRSHSPTLR